MGRGGTIYVGYTASVLLSVVVPASAGLWDVNIDLSPAPSPEDGPPFSANATRNRSLLPYQIIGVVASYLGTVLILGILLLTVGKRLRRRAQAMTNQDMEMIKAAAGMFEASPINPPMKRWDGFARSKKSTASSLRSRSQLGSPSEYSLAVDQDVVNRDREIREQEMSRIYDIYWNQEEQKMGEAIATQEVSKSHSGLPALGPSRLDLQRVQSSDTAAPRSPLYAPTHQYYPASPHKSSQSAPGSGYQNVPLSPLSAQASQRARGPSISSNRTSEITTNQSSPRQTMRRSIRNLKISAPMQRLRDGDNDDDARTPLSPRAYTNPGSPPEPPTARTLESQGYPVTPGSTITADLVGEYSVDAEGLDQVRDLPQAYPQRGNELPAYQQSESPERRRGGNATNASSVLPFRQLNQDVRQTQRAQQVQALPGHWQPLHTPKLKTTVMEAPRSPLGAPLTGVPTPYSPYMPGGLVTPITPMIMSRDQRKQKQREERATRGVVTEDDQVVDEKDLWDYGY